MSTSPDLDKRSPHLPIKSILLEAIQLLRNEWISECRELLELLESKTLQSLLFTADCVARGVFDQDYLDQLFQDTTGEVKKLASNLVITKKRKLPSQKLVRVFKSTEPLGVTVRVEKKTGDIILSRVLVGGAAHRSGLVNVGDKILEVNGIRLQGRSHLDVINILQRECLKTMITFRVIVCQSSQLEASSMVKSYIVRAEFDYDCSRDALIPCNSIGLSFTKGTILTVLNRDDPHWWQACKELQVNNKPRMQIFTLAGLIPSQQLQERRIASMRCALRHKLDRDRHIRIFGGLLPLPFKKCKWSVQRVRRVMYDLNECIDYDREEICTYEPVVRYTPRPHSPRPVVLTGPPNVGCTTLIRMLINYRPAHYREPLVHTTRYKRFAEADGVDFYFVNETWMEREIRANNFVCHSKYKGNYYGLHKHSIQQVIDSGVVCIFKIEAKFLRLVYNAQWKPFIVFITPPNNIQQLTQSRLKYFSFSQNYRSRARFEYEMSCMIYEAHKLQYLYGNKFDATIVNDELHKAVEDLNATLASMESQPKWVPLSWVNKHA